MRIDGKPNLGAEQTDMASRMKHIEKRVAENGPSAQTAKTVASDAVVISGRAKDTVNLSRMLKDMPDVRKEKVTELKAKIASGAYDVSARTIAEKVVTSAFKDLF